MKMILTIFFIFSLISISHASVVDFCVADYNAPKTPVGYSCKSPENVTVEDFVYHGLNKIGNTSNIYKVSFQPAFDEQFPGVNGLGVSIARLDILQGGVVPLHTHPDASEVLLVTQGNIVAGFVSSNKVAYIKTLHKGDVMVFPQGLLHFQINSGGNTAIAYTSHSSENPGVQILDLALFRNNFPSWIINATTFIDYAEVKRIKALFQGSD
ncbi:auxin-binding protein abp19a-like [Trifolium pratense]|uniref:Germin-like protein n=2 Tax=Trifolium pratense TaxID=57577 RepID=A0A2K3LBT8_TRIPR|nr:auxin-binding protein abp19a-like [Trifolium pratense]CAJ2638168.1 unnamed protein product [Trifolium pratense]